MKYKKVQVNSINDLPEARRTKGRRLEFRKSKRGRFYRKASFMNVYCEYYYDSIHLETNTTYLMMSSMVINDPIVISSNSTITGKVESEGYCLPISYTGGDDILM